MGVPRPSRQEMGTGPEPSLQAAATAIRIATTANRFMTAPGVRSQPHVEAYLNAAGPAEGRTTEERALQQIIMVQDVFYVHLRPEDGATHHERITGARVQNEARVDLDGLVEIEQARAVRRVRIRAVSETRAVDAVHTHE